MRILIIEDEKRLADSLKALLESRGFTVETAYDGETGAEYAELGIYDLLILDVMMPGLNGYALARQVRARRCAVPILMLTAKSEVLDRIEGLNAGADYYLTKPFDPKELLACIRALTRRQPELRNTDSLEFNGLRLEKNTFLLSCKDRSVRLSRKEFDMMELFLLNRNLVLTKESLLLKIWGYESDAEDNNVEVYISFLRKKLAHLHANVKIRTIRMVGYCLEAAEG